MLTTDKDKHRLHFIVSVCYFTLILAIAYFILKYFINLVMPFFLATIFAAVTRPLAKYLSRKERTRKRKDGRIEVLPCRLALPYNVAAILSLVIFFLLLNSLIAVIIIPVVEFLADKVAELPAFYSTRLEPELGLLFDRIQDLPGRFDDNLREIMENAVNNLSGSLGSFITSFSGKVVVFASSLAAGLPGVLLNALICLIATVFIALDFDTITGFFKRNLAGNVLHVISRIKESLVEIVWQFIRSYFFIFLITCSEIALGLLLLGYSRPLLIGVLIAIFDAFPIVGSGMILLPWSLVVMLTSGFVKGIGLFFLYLFVVIVRQIIEPKIVGKHVGLRPILTLVTMFIGSKLFGAVGLFGLPITAAILTDLNSQGIFHLFRRPDISGEKGPEKTKE